jgi:hypothetical protein
VAKVDSSSVVAVMPPPDSVRHEYDRPQRAGPVRRPGGSDRARKIALAGCGFFEEVASVALCPYPCLKGDGMPKTPNYRFERNERDRAKAAKKAEKQAAKASKKTNESADEQKTTPERK